MECGRNLSIPSHLMSVVLYIVMFTKLKKIDIPFGNVRVVLLYIFTFRKLFVGFVD